jgi:glycine hydroxymethyltransferase
MTFTDQEINNLVNKEIERQQGGVELIASENYPSREVLAALASPFHNKYAEGYPGKRYYAGNEVVDEVENLAISRAKQIFGAEHVNVQPLSGGPANYAVLSAFLNPGDTFLALALDHGGHLTHGLGLNFSGKLYNPVFYHVKQDGFIDMAEVESLAKEHKPKLIIAGFSAYSRNVDWKEFARIAKENGAISFADIAHIAGLIAGGELENPVPLFDVVSTTTHKTLRGPRGAIIMCKEIYASQIDKAVFPGLQGGPHQNSILAKAISFGEALTPEYKNYAKQVILNSKFLAQELSNAGLKIVSGGTDNHMFLVDVFNSLGIGGNEAQDKLSSVGIVVNKNLIPFDTRKPMDPSGIRIGTPAITTRGAKEEDMKVLSSLIVEALKAPNDIIKQQVIDFSARFPINY